MKITYEEIRKNETINTYIKQADLNLTALGFTEHSFPHVCKVAEMAGMILEKLGYDEHIATIVAAIGNHDESTAFPVNPVAAALIIADKSDVRESRVRDAADITSDIHDRVNYAVKEQLLTVIPEEKKIVLTLEINNDISEVMEYFEIFMGRMKLCKKAAEKLGMKFKLIINSQEMA